MPLRVAINGLGRIGRSFFRASLVQKEIEVVAINDLGNSRAIAHLLQYDSLRGKLPEKVTLQIDGKLQIGTKTIELLNERDPAKLPWDSLDVDIVLEASGSLHDVVQRHLAAGAKKVVISSPVPRADAAFIMGINEDQYNPQKHHIISNASCTANCLAMMIKVLQDSFGGVTSGLITNIHAMSRLQGVHDSYNDNLRLARAGSTNMVPHSPGLSEAIAQAMPELAGILQDYTVRVPVQVGSLVDLTALLTKSVSAVQVNQAMYEASVAGSLAPYLDYAEAPIVSSDVISDQASCIFDPTLTQTVNNQVRVVGWHDNEWGYASRLVDLVRYVGVRL